MKPWFSFTLLPLLLLLPLSVAAQTIKGSIFNPATGDKLEGVTIENIHSNARANTNIAGEFSVGAKKGELIEFRKMGFKTIRIRLTQENLPTYFKIAMEVAPVELDEVNVNGVKPNYHADSTRYARLYKQSLEFPELKGLDVIQHPFSALSKKNRQIWAFQKEYAWFQEQKYVDYAFNERLITRITGFTGDSLQNYMRMFRPTANQLRGMDEYNFYVFIKRTGKLYRERGPRARLSQSRNSY